LGGRAAADLGQEKKALLFEKRSKNFCPLARTFRQRARLISKSFLVLFFKKELLAFTSSPAPTDFRRGICEQNQGAWPLGRGGAAANRLAGGAAASLGQRVKSSGLADRSWLRCYHKLEEPVAWRSGGFAGWWRRWVTWSCQGPHPRSP